METVIVYRSILGITKKYATWLAEDLKADLFTFNKVEQVDWSAYDAVIIASGTYASWMPLTGFLKKHWPILKDKKVIVVSVGISPEDTPYTRQILEKIPEEIRKTVKIVRLPGAIFGKTPSETGVVKRENIKKVIKFV